jgi:hypothetical protein
MAKVKKWAVFKHGALGGWKKALPAKERRRLLEKLVKDVGYATTIRKLLQLRNVTKDKETVKKATDDMAYLRKKFRERPVSRKGKC